jgi:YesN/AraC family two-component response regulator
MEEMHSETKRLYKAVCEYIKSERSRYREKLLAGISEYIDQSYGDGMLSLVTIAEKFNITPPYLSAFFKKQSGQNITDYIAKVRVAQAKRLMKDRTLNLSQIALMVGYANDIGFIRVFKKLEGITPGKFREQMKYDHDGPLLPQ